MPESHIQLGSDVFSPDSDQTWYDLYAWLMPFVEVWVNSIHIDNWHGQRRDISEDVVQDAIIRIFTYHQQSLQDTGRSIRSLKAFSKKVALNLLRDKIKKEKRLVRLTVIYGYGLPGTTEEPVQEDINLDHLDVVTEIARIIASLPRKQKTALLVDLANRLDLDDRLSSFEQALQAHGLCLRHYQYSLPTDSRERGRHTTLLSLARKRLKRELRQFYQP
jgi:DNA-directed RNA polymerase specialized sigma24 family protein